MAHHRHDHHHSLDCRFPKGLPLFTFIVSPLVGSLWLLWPRWSHSLVTLITLESWSAGEVNGESSNGAGNKGGKVVLIQFIFIVTVDFTVLIIKFIFPWSPSDNRSDHRYHQKINDHDKLTSKITVYDWKFMAIIVIDITIIFIYRLASKLAPSLHPLELSLCTAAWVTGVLLSMARWGWSWWSCMMIMMITMTIKLMMIEMIKMIKITMRNTFSLYSAGQAAVRELHTVDLVQPWWRFGSEGPPVRKDSTGWFPFLCLHSDHLKYASDSAFHASLIIFVWKIACGRLGRELPRRLESSSQLSPSSHKVWAVLLDSWAWTFKCFGNWTLIFEVININI